jgi:predicted Rossmann fold nucleotide-binding protein DprA/Smf involved in DNA uptake
MAVPAAPSERRSAGCVRLLLAGAMPCTDADDILAALAQSDGPLLARAPASAGAHAPRTRAPRERAPQTKMPSEMASDDELTASLDGDGRLVYDSLSSVARHVDELARLTGLPAARLQRSLTTLVLSGLADDRGDGRFARA